MGYIESDFSGQPPLLNADGPWQAFDAVLVPGHRVASGLNGNPKFPGGTIVMQIPVFKKMGLDLSGFFQGTLNASIAPLHYRMAAPRVTLRQVKWHPEDPAEDFSFVDVRLRRDGRVYEGFIYYPHPDTKPVHFQKADVLELLLPKVEGAAYGDALHLEVPVAQMAISQP